jgi:hypothetical protein
MTGLAVQPRRDASADGDVFRRGLCLTSCNFAYGAARELKGK